MKHAGNLLLLLALLFCGGCVSQKTKAPVQEVRFSPPTESLFDAVTEFNRVMAETRDSDLLLGAMLMNEKRRPRIEDDDRKHAKLIRTRWHGATDLEMIHEARLLLRKQWIETLDKGLERQMESLQIYNDGASNASFDPGNSIGGIVSLPEKHLFRPSEENHDKIELKMDELEALRGYGRDCRQLCEKHGLLPFEGVFDVAVGHWVLHPDRKMSRLRPIPWVSLELTTEVYNQLMEGRHGKYWSKPESWKRSVQ